jgi:hypothetical protein
MSFHVRLKVCLSMKNKKSWEMINLLDCTELIPLWRRKYSLEHVKHIPEWNTTILKRHVENTSLYRQKKNPLSKTEHIPLQNVKITGECKVISSET